MHCCFCLQEEGRFSSILDPSEEFSICKKLLSSLFPLPTSFVQFLHLLLKMKGYWQPEKWRAEFCNSSSFFMAVCPKFPGQLWDAEHNDSSFYFSSSRVYGEPVKKKKNQNTNQPNKKTTTTKPPKTPNPIPLYFVVYRYLEKQEEESTGWNLNIWQGVGKLNWLLVTARQ